METRLLKGFSIFLALAILLSSCASTTMITSQPPGAKLFINGESVGKTPYSYTDSKIVGSTVSLKLEKDGYQSLTTSFSRNEELDIGPVILGIFFLWPLFLWTMKYKSVHSYELVQNENAIQNVVDDKIEQGVSGSKYEQLRDLKKLLDEGIINQEEYDNEKAKILGKNN